MWVSMVKGPALRVGFIFSRLIRKLRRMEINESPANNLQKLVEQDGPAGDG
jgi:hypothetical protein